MENTLSNEQAKQEAIKRAYGKHWEDLKHLVYGNGQISLFTNFVELLKNSTEHINLSVDYDKKCYQPTSIKGIDTNNGWIRIEPDGSNLPDKDGIYTFLIIPPDGRKPAQVSRMYEVGISNKKVMVKHFSHWIEQNKLPIY